MKHTFKLSLMVVPILLALPLAPGGHPRLCDGEHRQHL